MFVWSISDIVGLAVAVVIGVPLFAYALPVVVLRVIHVRRRDRQ